MHRFARIAFFVHVVCCTPMPIRARYDGTYYDVPVPFGGPR